MSFSSASSTSIPSWPEGSVHLFLENIHVVAVTVFGIVKFTSEVTVGVGVDGADGEFADAKSDAGCFRPKLQGDGVTRLRKSQAVEGSDPAGFETAEGVSDAKSKAAI